VAECKLLHIRRNNQHNDLQRAAGEEIRLDRDNVIAFVSDLAIF